MKKIRVAIIGQGRSGRDIHGAFLKSAENTKFEVIAVVDALEDRRERAKQEYGCDVYADYKELFSRTDIDLVINSSFSYCHYPITMDLLDHGFNVVVEKPFAKYAMQCDDMIRKAEEKGVMLDVFQQSRFAPYYVKLKEIVRSGILGEIKQVNIDFGGFSHRWDWQTSQRAFGGSMQNTGPHPIDQALDLMDYDDIPNVFSKLDTVLTSGDAEDYVKIILTAPGKPLFDIEISSCNAYKEPYLYKIQGSQGGLRASMSKVEWKYIIPSETQQHEVTLSPLSNDNGLPVYCSEKLIWHEECCELTGTAFDSAVKSYYEMIYAHMVDGKPLIVTPEQVKKQIEIMELVHAQNPLPVII